MYPAPFGHQVTHRRSDTEYGAPALPRAAVRQAPSTLRPKTAPFRSPAWVAAS